MSKTEKKTERIIAKVSVATREKLIEAAAFSGTTLNRFLVQAAVEKASEVLERERGVRLSHNDADVFFNALENPPGPNRKLRDAVKRYKQSGVYGQI